MTWGDAVLECQQLDAELASVDSAEQNGFILGTLSRAGIRGIGVWIGFFKAGKGKMLVLYMHIMTCLQ